MKYTVLITLLFCCLETLAQPTIKVTSGTYIKTIETASVVANQVDMVNDGSINASGQSTLAFTGALNNDLAGTGVYNLNNLLLFKTQTNWLRLQQNIMVSGDLQFQAGLLDLDNFYADLNSLGRLMGESELTRAYTNGTGYLRALTQVDKGGVFNAGNLGATIVATAGMGLTEVRRGHRVQTIYGSEQSIRRYYDIIPEINTGLNASLSAVYFDAELNSLDETELGFWKSSDHINWSPEGFTTRDALSNFVELTGINSFSRWTLALLDTESPVITSCPDNQELCYTTNQQYSIPVLTATDNYGAVFISYIITGATIRNGDGGNASGLFNPGISTITWQVEDGSGNTASCQATVTINKMDVTIPDSYAMPGMAANTVFYGYDPASLLTLASQVVGGTGPYNYVWTSGSPSGAVISTTSTVTVEPTATTTYYLIVTDSKGCVSEAASILVNVIDVRCGKNLDKVPVCIMTGNGPKTVCVSPNAVDALLNNGATLGPCGSITTTKIKEEPSKQLPIETKLLVRVMPNPSDYYFNIIVSSSSRQQLTLKVMDYAGRIIEARQNMPAENIIKIGANYRPGTYLVEIIQGSERVSLKLIKGAKAF